MMELTSELLMKGTWPGASVTWCSSTPSRVAILAGGSWMPPTQGQLGSRLTQAVAIESGSLITELTESMSTPVRLGLTSGGLLAAKSYTLAAGNAYAQDIADPPSTEGVV